MMIAIIYLVGVLATLYMMSVCWDYAGKESGLDKEILELGALLWAILWPITIIYVLFVVIKVILRAIKGLLWKRK